MSQVKGVESDEDLGASKRKRRPVPKGHTKPQAKVLRELPPMDGHIPVLYAMNAIRSFCLVCSETQVDVENCSSTRCFLWPYRFAKGYGAALASGLVVDPNTPEAHALKSQYRPKTGAR